MSDIEKVKHLIDNRSWGQGTRSSGEIDYMPDDATKRWQNLNDKAKRLIEEEKQAKEPPVMKEVELDDIE
jgi:hypothetical protein